jgi:hypothetical protein
VSSALSGVIRTGGDRGLFEYAAALIDVNESAAKRGARQVEGGDTANWKQRNAMGAFGVARWPPFVAVRLLSIRLS